MSTFWDSRYNTEQFIYGKAPNMFFSSELNKLSPGNLLLPGEGEGRNAVYAATQGWVVDAFDQSNVGSEKAKKFAGELGVKINYQVCGAEEFQPEEAHYDVVALTFFHADTITRKMVHAKVIRALKTGGLLILEAFHTDQLGMKTGGPQSEELLFNAGKLRDDFSPLELLHLEELTVELDEGPYHQGEAHVIRFLGKKE